MDLERSVDVAADLTRTWAALVDIESWPRFSRSMRSVERLDEGPLRVGSRARVRQPGSPALVWEVTVLRPHEVFTWVATTAGVRIVGDHRLAPNPDGTTHLTLGIEQSGALAGLVGALTRRRTSRFLDWEADGLRRAGEGSAGGEGSDRL